MNEYNEPWGIELTPDTIWVGPLRTDGTGKVAEGVFQVDIEGLKPESKDLHLAEAKRIVAAVNFCAGVSSEELAKGNLKQLKETLTGVRRNNDNLSHELAIAKSQPTPAVPPALLEALRLYINDGFRAIANLPQDISFDMTVQWQRVLDANERRGE